MARLTEVITVWKTVFVTVAVVVEWVKFWAPTSAVSMCTRICWWIFYLPALNRAARTKARTTKVFIVSSG